MTVTAKVKTALSLSVAWLLVALLSQAYGRQPYLWQARLVTETREFGDTLKAMDGALEGLPEKIQSTHWSSVKSEALEIKQNAGDVLDAIRSVGRLTSELSIENGSLQKRLDRMIADFNRLAVEAESAAYDLPEPLASTVRREQQVYLRGAKIADMFKTHYRGIALGYEEQVKDLKRAEPILARMMNGADLYVELAEVGEQLEQAFANLDNYVEQLNTILDMFDSLGDHTENAIAQSDPSTSPLFSNAARVANVPEASLPDRSSATAVNFKTASLRIPSRHTTDIIRVESTGYRRWTSPDRQHTCVARLIDIRSETVTLEREDGQRISVDINRLSLDDQKYIATHRAIFSLRQGSRA